MMLNSIRWLLAALCVVGLIATTAAQSQFKLQIDDPFAQQPHCVPVAVAFQFAFRQHGNQLVLKWQIAGGYYMSQHRFLVQSPVQLSEAPELPDGEPHFDEFFGEASIY